MIDYTNKKVLIRVDFNVPLDKNHHITDDTRIRKAIPTIKEVLDGGGSVILMSHLGRPQKKTRDDGSIDVEAFTLGNIVDPISKLLGVPVHFAGEVVGEAATAMSHGLMPGQVMLLENTRFEEGEKKGDEKLARQLADLADIYINDAFGTAHRAHASTTTVAQFFAPENRSFGKLIQAELENSKKVLNNPAQPFVAIVGGAKVSDKINLLGKLLDKVQRMIIGGAMAYTFIKAQGGKVGDSLVEDDKLDLASELLKKAKDKGVDIYLPIDAIIADNFDKDALFKTAPSGAIPDGWMGLDIGEQARKDFTKALEGAGTILWNGPMGVFEMENFAHGTKAVAQAVADATKAGAFSLIGGGDSVAAVNQMGLSDEVSFVSTGGGAMLELLEGKTLPGVAAINEPGWVQ